MVTSKLPTLVEYSWLLSSEFGHVSGFNVLSTYLRSSFRPYDDPDRLKGSEVLQVLHAVGVFLTRVVLLSASMNHFRTPSGAYQA